MEVIASSEQPKMISPNDTKAILKHVSCYAKNCLHVYLIPVAYLEVATNQDT